MPKFSVITESLLYSTVVNPFGIQTTVVGVVGLGVGAGFGVGDVVELHVVDIPYPCNLDIEDDASALGISTPPDATAVWLSVTRYIFPHRNPSNVEVSELLGSYLTNPEFSKVDTESIFPNTSEDILENKSSLQDGSPHVPYHTY